MTKEQLTDQHMIQFRAALPGADVFSDMADVTILYAIYVLEGVLKKEKKENKFLHDIVIEKKKELQSLIK